MAGDITLRKPKEVEFYYNGHSITPSQIFTLFYSGLENLSDFNRSTVKIRDRVDVDEGTIEDLNAKSTAKKKLWQSGIQDVVVSARIRFDDNTDKSYGLRPRTNFEASGIFKAPNIAYLTDHDGKTVILREARVHPRDIAYHRMTRYFGNHFDRNASDAFYMPHAPVVSPPAKKENVMLIPEPQLLAAMEHIYANTNAPRVTPKAHVIGNTADKMWYLRDMYQIASDISLTPQNVGRYTGLLQALGLMELADARQLVHYYDAENGGIGNYDFDFMAQTANTKLSRHREMHDIERVIAAEGASHKVDEVPAAFAKEVDAIVKRAIPEYAAQGINVKTIFKYVKPQIDVSIFPQTAVTDLY